MRQEQEETREEETVPTVEKQKVKIAGRLISLVLLFQSNLEKR